MPYYHGMITERLIKAGYGSDSRIKKAFDWLLKMRQNDGAWAVPLVKSDLDWKDKCELSAYYADPIEPDFSMPFSHMCTGMVIRA